MHDVEKGEYMHKNDSMHARACMCVSERATETKQPGTRKECVGVG